MGSQAGLINSPAFSAIVAAVLLSTLITPPMLRFAFHRLKPKPVLIAEEGSEK